jgi:hypothetical protein
MNTLSYLTDVHGPRLTNSPGMRSAAEWAKTQLTAWGLSNVHFETWGPFGRGWANERFHAQMVEPQGFQLLAFPKAWTPGTNGPVTAEAVMVSIEKEEDFAKYQGKLAGKIATVSPLREFKAKHLDPVLEAVLLKQNIRVVGHADSRTVGLTRALKAKQQIEHLDSYLEALLPDSSPIKGSVSDIYLYNPKNWESIDHLDESKIPEIARQTVNSNPFVVPTLHLFKFTFGKGRSEESFMAQPDIRFYPKKVVDLWMGVSKKYLSTAAPIEKREKYIGIRNKLVKAIYDAGGHVMAGSDTPEWLMLYGHTLHLELVDLRDAGLSNYAALEAATRNPALFFGTLNKTGTIEKGKRANLVLLDANPLDDIANTQKRAGVMLNGKYYQQSEMNKWLDEIASRFQHALDERK